MIISLLGAAWAPTHAQQAPPSKAETEAKAAWVAAEKAAVFGPAEIKLLDQASLKLAPDQAFIPAAEANRVMMAIGNPSSPERYGLIISQKSDSAWMVDISWVKEGYIRDGEAREWKPDALLESLKQNTEEANAERQARGVSPLDVIGWVEKPSYDPTTHRLVWSLSLHDRGAPTNFPETINYNIYALGREGYFELDLITGSDSIAADKQVARDLLGSLNYVSGKRYQDFNGSTDKVATYGLGALIGVVAAKKLGLLAVIGVFLLKAWKLGMVALVAAGAGLRRFFGKRPPPDADA